MTPTGIDTHYDAFLREGGRELLVNGEGQGKIDYVYNDDSQVTEIKMGEQTLLRFQYDGDGRLGDVDGKHGLLEGSSITGANSVNELITHDAYGRVDTRDVYSGGEFVYSLDVRKRDGLGRITEQSLSRGEGSELVRYTYDSRGQLETVSRTGEPLLTYKYDGNGNRLCSYEAPTIDCTSWKYSDRNELRSDGTYDYTYDAGGTLETRLSLTDSSLTEYDYDLLGALRSVKFRDGVGAVTKLIAYQNDHAGRRISRAVTSGGVTNRKQYVWSNALQIEAELDEFGTVVSRFVYGLRPNVPELIVRSDDTYRVITDERGSPVYVVGITHGNVLLEASYDEWGVPFDITVDGVYQNDSVAGWPIPHGFAGGLFDETTRLVRFGARDYSSEMGRWTNKDPILFRGRDTNLYRYVNNDPVNLTDPIGLWSITVGPQVSVQLQRWAGLHVGAGLVVAHRDGAAWNKGWSVDGQALFGPNVSTSETAGFAGLLVEVTNADHALDLSGVEGNLGVGVTSPSGLAGFFDFVKGFGYEGVAGGIGLGLPGYGIWDLHGGATIGLSPTALAEFLRRLDGSQAACP